MKKDNEFHVYLDTNQIIFGNPFRRDLIKIIDSFKNNSKISLFFKVPEVVVLEYQHKTLEELKTTIKDFNEKTSTINYFFNKKIRKLENVNLTHKKVLAIFKKFNIEIIHTPIKKINLKKLIINAVEHIAPFEKKGEKGFRDSVIVETIRFNLSGDVNNIFISDDQKLRNYLENHSSLFKNLKTYSFIKDFESYLSLHALNLNDSFINELTKKAEKYFYDPISKSGLFIEQKIEDKIKNQNNSLFNRLTSFNTFHSYQKSGSVTYGNFMNSMLSDIARNQYDFYIHQPYFISRNKANEYTWDSLIVFNESLSLTASPIVSLGSASLSASDYTTSAYATAPLVSASPSSSYFNPQIVFSIRWQTIIDEKSNIISGKIINIQYHSSNFSII
jgi:hypothetical protein